MSEITPELLFLTAAKAAWNASAEVKAAKSGENPELWVDLPKWHQDDLIEVVKSILGQPNKLTPEDQIDVGDVGLFVNTVQRVTTALGKTIIVDLPQPVFVPVEQSAPEPDVLDQEPELDLPAEGVGEVPPLPDYPEPVNQQDSDGVSGSA